MKNLASLCIIVLWTSGLVAQNSNMVFSSRINYLPSSSCRYEYYIQNGQSVKHKYEKESNNCWDLKFSKGRKIDSISLITISEFVRDINSRDTLIIHLSKKVQRSLNNRLLTNSNYFKNDSLTLIFSQFETEYYKPDSSMFGLPVIEVIQIDGNWLSANFVANQDTLLSVHKSYSGYPRVSGFKQWLTYYLICNKYKLFQDLQITSYISDKNYLYMLNLYLETMKD